MDKTLVIIDGNSIVNRAFYALPDLTNKQGLHTNAIYGFTTMLFKIIEMYKPTHISVAFDKKAPTFRHLEYKEYKAGRKKMPDELREQLEPLKNLLDAFNINRLELEGYEADDIIGTVSLKAEQEGYKVYIVTGDKDAIQLASNTTTTLITKKGVGEVEEYDFDEVMKKYQMTPTQFIDLKGLMGDKSDNIPGVPGIGEVTGIKLIKEFGSIENIIENIDSIKGSPKKKLQENKELAIMSKRLATIIRDVPIEVNLDELIFGDYDKSKLIQVFNELGFNSLIARIGENSQEDGEPKELCELIENDFDSEYSNGKFRIKNIFPTEKNEGILLKNKNKIKIELGKDPTLSAPWKENRLLKCFVTIGSEIKYIDKVYNIKEKATWKQDYQNHYSILYMPMGVTVIGNGNHSSATGILKKEGIIEINEIIDLSDTYDTIKFDGEYFINIESNEKICKPSFYEFGIIYEIGRLIKEKGINFKNYNEIIERL